MNVRKIFFAFFMILLFLFPGRAYALSLPQRIRVGLEAYKSAGEIRIGNKEIQIGYESNSSFILSTVISATGAFSAVPANQYYVRVESYFYDYSAARQSAEGFKANGYKACVGLLDDNYFAVYLGGYQNDSEAATAKSSLSYSATIIDPAPYRTAVTDGGLPVIIFDNSSKNGQIRGDSALSLGDRSYRGTIELCRVGSTVTAVNVLTTDEYLYSVVASEMPSGWHIEALKAQAVASRSYLVTRMGAHSSSSYHICDAAHCQLYLGEGSETDASRQAVNETSGIMAYYSNEPINAVYFSSSGGSTADSESVWPNSVPYLRSVPDPNEKTGKEWQRSFTLSEITAMLSSKGYSVGSAVSVSASVVSASGRVDRLDIVGTSGTASLEKENIRTFFSSSSGGSLESRMFNIGSDYAPVIVEPRTVSKVFVQGTSGVAEYDIGSLYAHLVEGLPPVKLYDAVSALSSDSELTLGMQIETKTSGNQVSGGSSTADTIVFTGRGYGHGVGMSQHGANGMAEAGYTFREILSHYYTGIEIR